MQIQRQQDRICIKAHDGIYFYLHKDSLEHPSAPMIKANHFVLHGTDGTNKGPNAHVLIDTLIFDGHIGRADVSDVLQHAAASNIPNCSESFKKRPSLHEEVLDIYSLLFGENNDRMTSFHRIRYIQHGPSLKKKYRTLEWSIHRELSAIYPSEKNIS